MGYEYLRCNDVARGVKQQLMNVEEFERVVARSVFELRQLEVDIACLLETFGTTPAPATRRKLSEIEHLLDVVRKLLYTNDSLLEKVKIAKLSFDKSKLDALDLTFTGDPIVTLRSRFDQLREWLS